MSFDIEVSEEEVRREKRKARELRQTRWWREKIDAGLCHYCGEKFTREDLTMDHIVPLIRGGRSVKANCVPACKDCNSRKRYLLPMEWEEYLQGMGHSETHLPPFDKGRTEEG